MTIIDKHAIFAFLFFVTELTPPTPPALTQKEENFKNDSIRYNVLLPYIAIGHSIDIGPSTQTSQGFKPLQLIAKPQSEVMLCYS